jgi:hypothetical protein
MPHLLRDLIGATGSLLWPVHRPLAVIVLRWAADAPDLKSMLEPTLA